MSAAVDQQEMPDLSWRGAAAAYLWAVEQASRPDYQSPAEVMRRNGMGGCGGSVAEFGPQDYRDMAHTILAAVARIPEPFARDSFRYVWSDAVDRAPSLASTVAEHVLPASTRGYSAVKKVALTAVFRVRTQYRWNKPAGISWYARSLGMYRQNLYRGPWPELIDLCERDFRQALDRGARAARQELAELEIIR